MFARISPQRMHRIGEHRSERCAVIEDIQDPETYLEIAARLSLDGRLRAHVYHRACLKEICGGGKAGPRIRLHRT